MQQQLPIVIECPECGEQYIISNNKQNNRSKKAIIYSDGFFIDPVNWRTPSIAGCTTCELGFFTEQGRIVAQPEIEEFEKKWKQLKHIAPPVARALALELRIRKNMKPDIEIKLRKEFWYAGLHSEKGQMLLSRNEIFKTFWNNSLLKLEKLLSTTSAEELLLKAELNRQIGHFDSCIQMLEGCKSNAALQLVKAAKDKNSSFFQLK